MAKRTSVAVSAVETDVLAPATPVETQEEAPVDDAGDVPQPRKEPAPEPESDKGKPKGKMSAIRQSIINSEDAALKEWSDLHSVDGAFKFQVYRDAPETALHKGRMVPIKGFLDTVDSKPDEESLRNRWGGGTFRVKVTKRSDNGGPTYVMHRSFTVSGAPNLDAIPGIDTTAGAPVVVSSSSQESPVLVGKAMDVLSSELAAARRGASAGTDPAVLAMFQGQMQQMTEQLRMQADAHQREMTAMREELGKARTPVVDPIKDKILDGLLTGQSGHVEALRLRHEAEIRQIKESHIQDLKRIEDRHDRLLSEANTRAEAALASVRASYEREISAMRSHHDVLGMTQKATADVQVTTLQAEVRRLENDITQLRGDNKELRDRKEKGLAEQIKDVEVIRGLLGADEKESGAVEKIIEALPTGIEAVGKMFQNRGQPAPQTVQAQAVAKPRVFKDAQGNRVVQQGNQLVPVKPKPKLVPQADGSQLQLPTVDAEEVARAVAMLESAFRGGQDPVIVASSARSMVPPNIIEWIGANDTETQAGIDLFARHVAKLPSNSPLISNQMGKNWLRKFGKALVGRDE